MENQYQIFIIFAFFAAILMIALAIYIARFRYVRGTIIFIHLLIMIALWTFSIGAGLMADSEIISYRWAIFRMLGVVLVPFFWFLFSLKFVNQDRWLNAGIIVLMCIIPFISIVLMITNEYHQLFLKDIVFTRSDGYLNDETWILGPWFWVHLIYSYGLILSADFLFIREAFRLVRNYKKQTYVLLSGAILPLLVNIFYTFHLIPGLKVNYDPLGLVFTGIIFSFGLFQYRLFDLGPIARNLVVESMQDGMFILDRHLHFVELNPAAEKIVDFEHRDLVGVPALEIFEGVKFDINQKTKFEFSPYQTPGRIYEGNSSPIVSAKRNCGLLIILRDISDQKAFEQSLKEKAENDALTGLKNKESFFIKAEAEINRARRFSNNLVVGFMDLDHFKFINDQYGHIAGDQALKRTTEIIKKNLRSFDLIGRFGGDEFVFLFPQTSLIDADLIMERIRFQIKQSTLDFDGKNIPLSGSYGLVSNLDFPDADIKKLVELADKEMYKNKYKTKK